MAATVGNSGDLKLEPVLRDCIQTLRRVAAYRLPPAMDRRLLWLSENKATLTESEREELEALIEISEDRTVEKLEAQAFIKRVGDLLPHLTFPRP